MDNCSKFNQFYKPLELLRPTEILNAQAEHLRKNLHNPKDTNDGRSTNADKMYNTAYFSRTSCSLSVDNRSRQSNQGNAIEQRPGVQNMRQIALQKSTNSNEELLSIEDDMNRQTPDVTVNKPNLFQNVKAVTFYKNCSFKHSEQDTNDEILTDTNYDDQIDRPQQRENTLRLQNSQNSDLIHQSSRFSQEQTMEEDSMGQTVVQSVAVSLPLDTETSHISMHSDQSSNDRRLYQQRDMKNSTKIPNKVSQNRQQVSNGQTQRVIVGRTIGEGGQGIAAGMQNSHYFQHPQAQIIHARSPKGNGLMRGENKMNNTSMQNSNQSKPSDISINVETKKMHLRELATESNVINTNRQLKTIQNSPNITTPSQSYWVKKPAPADQQPCTRNVFTEKNVGADATERNVSSENNSGNFLPSQNCPSAADQPRNDVNVTEQRGSCGNGAAKIPAAVTDNQPEDHQVILGNILCSKFRDFVKKINLLTTDKFSVLYSALSICAENKTTDTFITAINVEAKPNIDNATATTSKVEELKRITPEKRVKEKRDDYKAIYEHDSSNSEDGDNDDDYTEDKPKKRRTKPSPYTLPPEYDASDSKWTLKHQETAAGLVELMPGSCVFINYIELINFKRIAGDYETFATLLLKAIFTESALKTCSLQGGHNAFNTPPRPGLDAHALAILLEYVKNHGLEKDWGQFIRRPVLIHLRHTLSKIRKGKDN